MDLLKQYIVVIGFLVVASGIILLLIPAAGKETVTGNVLINLGCTLIGTGLIVIIYKFALPEIIARRSIERSGLVEFRMRRSELFRELDIGRKLRGSSRIGLCAVTLNSVIEQVGRSAIADMATRGTKFVFLFMNPDAVAVSKREHQEGLPKGSLRQRILTSIGELRQLRKDLPEHARQHASLKCYDLDTSGMTLISDDLAVFQPYFEGADANDSPTFVYRRSKPGVYSDLQKHFTLLEERSMDVSVPMVIMMSGHTCSGKTNLAEELASECNMEVVSTRSIRAKLYPTLTNAEDFRLDSQSYLSTSDRIYKTLTEHAEIALGHSAFGVILDGSFPFRRMRKAIYDACGRFGANLTVIQCECPDESEVKKRLDRRKGDSKLHPTERARDLLTYESSMKDAEILDPQLEITDIKFDMIRYRSDNGVFILPDEMTGASRWLVERHEAIARRKAPI